MKNNQRVLIGLLSIQDPLLTKKDQQSFCYDISAAIQELTSLELAELYVDNGFLQVFLKFLEEQLWLQTHGTPPSGFIYAEFITPFLKVEFSPRIFLHPFLQASSASETQIFEDKTVHLEKMILGFIKTKSIDEQKIFSTQVLNSISNLFEFENQLQLKKKRDGQHLGFSMYRIYDSMDEVFNLNYLADRGMFVDLKIKERLYEGAGVGVQSGYSTVLTALRYLNPAQGSRFIDLGSGYGRLGLVIGLLRPDIQFTGYEYVQHRVDIAMATVMKFDLQSHVQFYTQDLARVDFQIPDSEIYYLYDPFSEETYKYVLAQLMKISKRKKISIATKGNARQWLIDITQNNGWSYPEEFDNGNLCLFKN